MERLPLPARLVRPLGYPRVTTLPEEQQRGMRAFWLDGLFSSVAGAFADPYYTLYLLSLQATNGQIGLVNTLNQLIAAAVAVPGAALADRTGRYKRVVLGTGVVSRLLWIVMLTAPWLAAGSDAVWIVLLGWVGIAGVGALGNAAWTALSADVVPTGLRGGYFASRNIAMQLAQLVLIPVAGLLINQIGEPGGYQLNLGIAFVVALVSLYFYSRLPEHRQMPSDRDRFPVRELLRRSLRMPIFMRFVVAHSILRLGVMLGGPFINVYQAQELGFDAGLIGVVTTVGVLASVIGMRFMGRVHDRHGITWTMRFGVAVPLITVAWLWVQEPWQAFV
ncbi:MAG: MFS transporter, partial [Anaerolineae bacterium]|nr:MFS transporter [Anaerolineae bacterium]